MHYQVDDVLHGSRYIASVSMRKRVVEAHGRCDGGFRV